jgi:MFS family permease
MRHTERWAVSALFLTNGALFASMVPRLPEIKSSLGLTDGQLGLALLGIGLGGLAGSLSTRFFLPRVGSRRAAVGSTLALAAGMPLVALARSATVLFVVFVACGVANAITDVSMNAAGVEAQRRLGRPVLSSMHGVWSIGAVAAALLASVMAGFRVPLTVHLTIVGGVCSVLAVAVARWVPSVSGEGTGAHASGARFSRVVVALCGLAILAALIEAVPNSWSAIYLSDVAGAGPGVAGLGFTAFTTAMVLGRLVADRAVDRFSPVVVVRAGGLISGLALTAGLLIGGPVAGIAAFAAVGLGSAAVFPAMITAAGAQPGQAVGAVNFATRIGFLAAPPTVGVVADAVGLPLAIGLLVALPALGLSVFAGAVRLEGSTTAAG